MHIDLHKHAKEDLLQLKHTNPHAVAAVLATLEQIESDPNFIDKLTTHGENHLGIARLGVRQWQEAKGKANLWRFRIFDTPATIFRVVYGYHWQTKQLCIFAVVHKEQFNYELNSDIAKRILADWRSL